MILDAACEYFGEESKWKMQEHLPEKQIIQMNHYDDEVDLLASLLQQHYPVQKDYQKLLSLKELPPQGQSKAFDLLRKNYPERYEYGQFIVKGVSDNKKTASQIERLLFTVE